MTHKERSLNQFLEIYQSHDPQEISRRCSLPFDGKSFSLRIMGKDYRASFPEFHLTNSCNEESADSFENILFLRFLCEGKYTEAHGKHLSYREIPWGQLYYPNFEGRCLKRLAGVFENKLDVFNRIMEERKELKAEKLKQGDSGWRFEFLNGLQLSFIIWTSDDEFPASSQILFSDNFPSAFTAEDMAVVPEVAIEHLLADRKDL